jgi:uncharacterized protein (TIGR02597 family)
MKKLAFLVGLLAALFLSAVQAANTTPVGGITITIAGATNGVPKTTTFTSALRMSLSESFVGKGRGTFTGVTDTTFTDSSAGWSAGALSQAATPYFVRVRSGTGAGMWYQVSTTTANTSTSLTILNRGAGPSSARGITAGDTYEIVPGETLSSLLGSLTASMGGASAAAADAVRVHDGVSWREYYYNSTTSQWREGLSTFDRSNTVIRADTGVVILRRGTGDLTLRIRGTVSDAAERVLVNPTGVIVVGSVFPVARTLGSWNIQTMSGFVPNTGNITAADKVMFFDGVNFRSFQYNSDVSQWREGLSTFNRNTLPIPFGSPVIIERGTGATGGIISFSLQPPYTL